MNLCEHTDEILTLGEVETAYNLVVGKLHERVPAGPADGDRLVNLPPVQEEPNQRCLKSS